MIRAGGPADLALLAALESRSFGVHAWHERALVGELDAGVVVVLEESGRALGYGIGRLILDEVELLRIATLPEVRGQGHGRALLEAFHQRAMARGAMRSLLEVRASNRAAIALYRAAGYQKDGMRRGYYADGEHALLLSCALGEAR